MNKINNNIIASLLVAVGIVLLGWFIKAGIDNLAFHDRNVTVKGLAEREVEANRVIWPISYEIAGNNLLSLYDQMTDYNKKITKFLTTNGIDKDEITITPPDIYNATTNQYTTSRQFDYSLSCHVTIVTTKVKKVRELLDRQSELLKEGVPYSNSYISYEFTALNDIKPEMIAEATKNAREAAAKFAEDSGSKVGKIRSASQGQFSIESQESTPFIKKVRVVSTIVYYLED